MQSLVGLEEALDPSIFLIMDTNLLNSFAGVKAYELLLLLSAVLDLVTLVGFLLLFGCASFGFFCKSRASRDEDQKKANCMIYKFIINRKFNYL